MEEQGARQWVWTDQYLVTSYDVDVHGKTPLPAIARFFQETAYNHANHLEFGYEHLKSKNLFWVLSRLSIRMEKYPSWRDHISIRTWAAGIDRLFALRDFLVFDEQGQTLGRATSSWLILDQEKRRPQRQDLLKERSRFFPKERVLEENAAKIPFVENARVGYPFPVRYSDLDLYNHVNNARYMQWIIDGFPIDILYRYRLTHFEINFLAEARMGDQIVIHTQDLSTEPLFFRHSVRSGVDDREFCLAQTRWVSLGAPGV